MKLGLCVVGCGEFARTFAQAMEPLRDEVDLFFASREKKRAETYAREFGGTDAFGAYRAAAADPRVQAMYLCTPHYLHLEHAVIAARAGKHILVEKPIARTVRESLEMVSQARKAGVSLMVAENYRFMPTVRGAKELIDNGTIGDLRLIQLQEEGSFRPSQWRNNIELNGGGVLIDGGIHKMDLLIYLSGMPEQVFAAALPPVLAGIGGEDGAVVMTRSPEGVVGVINHSWTAAQNPAPPSVTVSGSEGRIYFEIGSPWVRINDGNSERSVRFDGDLYGLAPMVREFRDSIAEGREPLTSGAAGIGALSVVLKAYESIKIGASVELA